MPALIDARGQRKGKEGRGRKGKAVRVVVPPHGKGSITIDLSHTIQAIMQGRGY